MIFSEFMGFMFVSTVTPSFDSLHIFSNFTKQKKAAASKTAPPKNNTIQLQSFHPSIRRLWWRVDEWVRIFFFQLRISTYLPPRPGRGMTIRKLATEMMKVLLQHGEVTEYTISPWPAWKNLERSRLCESLWRVLKGQQEDLVTKPILILGNFGILKKQNLKDTKK